MKRGGIGSALALAALISCHTAGNIPKPHKQEFKHLVRFENIVQSEAIAMEFPNDQQKRYEGIYFSDDQKYYYYYNKTLWFLGSDDEFSKIDPDYIVAKFAWAGPQVYGVMSGGHHLLYINVAKNIRRAINIEEHLKRVGNTRLIVPHIAGTEKGAYVVASDISAALYLQPLGDTVAVYTINLRQFLPSDETRIFLPQITQLISDYPAAEVNASNSVCRVIIIGNSAMCKSMFIDILFTLPEE